MSITDKRNEAETTDEASSSLTNSFSFISWLPFSSSCCTFFDSYSFLLSCDVNPDFFMTRLLINYCIDVFGEPEDRGEERRFSFAWLSSTLKLSLSWLSLEKNNWRCTRRKEHQDILYASEKKECKDAWCTPHTSLTSQFILLFIVWRTHLSSLFCSSLVWSVGFMWCSPAIFLTIFLRMSLKKRDKSQELLVCHVILDIKNNLFVRNHCSSQDIVSRKRAEKKKDSCWRIHSNSNNTCLKEPEIERNDVSMF